jgi:eukaryotic-like serine/threonine-protein kinase
VQQLHFRKIHHQDVKPSNVLVFDGAAFSKLADFGRAHCIGLAAPHDELDVPGALSYAPPEQLYGFGLPDRVEGRRAADLYLLGSMLFFLFDGFPLTTATLRHLAPEHRPSLNGIMDGHWTGNFTDILPYYREAYRIALAEFAEVLRDHLRKLDGLEYGTRSSLR